MLRHLYYAATAPFNPGTNRTYCGRDMNWEGYVGFSGFEHVKEIVTLDGILGQDMSRRDAYAEADFLVWQHDLPVTCYHDLPFLIKKMADQDPATYQILAIRLEPNPYDHLTPVPGFSFVGFDLMDRYGGNSTLTNCGGYPAIFGPQDINASGLLSDYDRARHIRIQVSTQYPEDDHADCLMWGIWRMSAGPVQAGG
jgi:hypothetical protein